MCNKMYENVKSFDYTKKSLQSDSDPATMEVVTQTNAVKSPTNSPKAQKLVYTVKEVAQIRTAYRNPTTLSPQRTHGTSTSKSLPPATPTCSPSWKPMNHLHARPETDATHYCELFLMVNSAYS